MAPGRTPDLEAIIAKARMLFELGGLEVPRVNTCTTRVRLRLR